VTTLVAVVEMRSMAVAVDHVVGRAVTVAQG
jgi:hypothetical protein